MSPTNDVMILPNAAPMMMPTAMSSTLPRVANSLNAFNMCRPPFSHWREACTSVRATTGADRLAADGV